jgi:hypothetical protein
MVNLSCGYYNAHSKSEFIVLTELENCLLLNIDMIYGLEKVYHHKTERAVHYNNYYSRWSDNEFEIDELGYCPECYSEYDDTGKCPECSLFEIEDTSIGFTDYLNKTKKKR